MSLQRLVEGDCGGNNSLVQLSSIVTRDGTLSHKQSHPADQFVQEFMAQSRPLQTFDMNTLLNKSANNHMPQSNQSHDHSDSWQSNFSRMSLQSVPAGSSTWDAIRPRQWGSTLPIHPLPMLQRAPLHAPSLQLEYFDAADVVELNQPFINVNNEVKQGQEGQELVDSVKDDEDDVAYTQFMSFMKKVGSGEVSLNSPVDLNKEEQINEMAEKYKDEWEKLSNVGEHPWLSNLNEKTNPFTEYLFTDNNVMLEFKNALELGKEKLKMGDIPGAVLCFEAAVKQQPDLAEGWLLLGKSQAENEQDPQAIAALNKCIEMDETSLEALMTLAAAYTNENYPYLAYMSLFQWLKVNPQYSFLISSNDHISDMSNTELQNHVQQLYIKAAQMNPSNVDPEVQCALGVLFNISKEFDKAIDCFKTAVMVKSDDSRLWNRLGATLANSERSEEAVDAYYRALELEPGFIRARYNVGITCMNLGAYKEAAEHFLVALNQQYKAQGVAGQTNNNTSSSTIWTTLRMVCAFMGKHELSELIDRKDLEQLKKHFDL